MITTSTLQRAFVVLFTISTISIYAEKNAAFSLICPPNVTVDCSAELWDLSSYGNATYHDYNGYHDAGNPSVYHHLNSCNTGYIDRTWTIEDPYWNMHTCTQTITVGSGQYGSPDIIWPSNAEVTGCNPDVSVEALGKPTWIPSECSMLGVSHSDKLYTVSPDCKKIMRKWTILDWCNMNNYNNSYTFTQIIKIINSEPPVINCPKEITLNSTDCKNGNLAVTPLVVNASQCGGQYSITNNSPYAIDKGANISGKYPIGTTKVTYTVTYGCGNKATCTTNVIVKNGMKPTPICVQGLTVALMGIDTDKDGINDEGMVDLWAKDLDWKSASTCGYNPLRFSFRPDSIVMFKRFTCDDLGQNQVKMYVTDSKGGQSYCVVNIDVQNNGAQIQNCVRLDTTTSHRLYHVAGKVLNISNTGIEHIGMRLIDTEVKIETITSFDTTYVEEKDTFINASGAIVIRTDLIKVITKKTETRQIQVPPLDVETDALGNFQFAEAVAKDKIYELKCINNEGSLSNIDNKDLELLTQFLIGKIQFAKPYMYVAADLNNDGLVTNTDLSIMTDYLSGKITSFDRSHAWYMDHEDYQQAPQKVLDNANMACVIKEAKADILNQNFILVQKGDLAKNGKKQVMALENRSNGNNKASATFTPNPFTENVSLNYTSSISSTIQIRMIDQTGKVIYHQPADVSEGENTILINVEAPSGIIFYEIRDGENLFHGKIVSVR